jgi:SNF2 family DNA or RNA helicase
LLGASSSVDETIGDDVDFEDPTAPLADGPGNGSSPAPASSPAPVTMEAPPAAELRGVRVRTLRVAPEHAIEVLVWLGDTLLDAEAGATVLASSSLEYWSLCARFARFLLAQQRFVPMLVQMVSGELKGAWRPWLSDEAMAGRAALLVGAMPPAARAAIDAHDHDAWAVTEDFLGAVVDAACRRALEAEDFGATIEGRDATKDPHVAWLASLLTRGDDLQGPVAMRQDIAKRVRVWIGGLEERGASSAWRLLLRLSEPDTLGMALDASPSPDDPAWTISFHLQSLDPGAVVVDASDIWLLKGETASILGRRLDQPQELLLKELGRASRLYKRLEIALSSSQPSELKVNTRQAYEFLREVRPVLMEQGVGVESPAWWDSPTARVGAKLMLQSEDGMDPRLAGGGLSSAGKAQLGLATLVNYTWEISVGDTTLSLQEFEQLAARRVPLVRVNGRWVEIRPEDVHAAIKFIRDNPGGRIRLSEAMRLAYASEVRTTGIPVVGLEATGWVQGFMSSEAATRQLEMLPPPKEFRGTLRPYQARGVSWMMFQERLGFGICLADDMGLGKTVQLLALLAYEREGASEVGAQPEALVPDPMAGHVPGGDGEDGASHEGTQAQEPKIGTILPHGVSPTLLLVPMSVVGNWQAETKRFCPHLTVLVHHGAERAQGEAFFEAASRADLVITTYSLAHRDREMLGRIGWGRIVLDEAQYIKNPASKQSQAARSFESGHRVALTGTPVENRLSELWSIMDFLNPGYLGGAQSFRSRFAVPIERYHDKHKGEQLRGLIRPFVLRRLKSDPTIIADLPAKLETREFAHLTGEQASLYESCVKRMLSDVDAAEGIQRRGLVLAALIKLKQICNHPSQALKDWDDASGRAPDPARSAKCVRLLEMLDEVIAEGEQSLIFTQFRTMGRMLEMMLRQRFGKDVLFIHGGTTQGKRVLMVEQFQRGGADKPVLLLSLRAGGVGLNLTAATHVFHFDRWWNPAVENQATDRAYRIGQTRTVQVHKFVVKGTLEERIDQMIESKSELAENIIGQGEQWLSELSTDQLRDILTLRNDAIDDLEGI